MRLSHLLTLIVNSIIVVAFLGLGSYTAAERSAERRLDIEHDARSLAESVAAGVADPLLERRLDKVETVLLRDASLGRVSELLVATADDRIVSLVRADHNGRAQPIYAPSPLLSQEAWQRPSAGEYRHVLTIDFGESIGWVGVSMSLAELPRLRRQIWFDTLLAALMAAGLASLLLHLVISRLSARIEAASEFSEQLVAQQGELMTVPSRVREIARLQDALNNASRLLQRQFSELRDSEARQRAITEATLDSLITIDTEGRVTGINPATVETFGYTSEEMVGALMADLIVPPQHRAAHTQGMRHYLETGKGPVLRQRIEITALRRDGSEFPVELTIVPFELEGRRHFLGSLRDITKRLALESEQQRTRAQLQQTLNDLAAQQQALDQHAIVSIADRAGNITYANQKMREVSQYSNEELLGHNHRLLKSALHDPDYYEELWRTISSGHIWHGELANRRKDGSIYWVASTIVPMLDLDGLPYQYIAIRTDITEQKETELELADKRASLEQTLAQYRESQAQLEQARAKEVTVGRQIQNSLLFGEVPAELGELSIAVHTEASQGVDGDFYDFFSYGPRLFDLSIGDVMGKGVGAALLGAALKQQLNRCIASNLAGAAHGHPAEPEALINAVHALTTPRLIELETFITLTYLRFDLDRRRISFVDAGHTPIILVGSGGARLLRGENLPLGVFESEDYRQVTADLQPGDLLFLYSDGVTEARDAAGDEFGVEHLVRLVSDLHAQKIPARMLLQAVRVVLQRYEERLVPSDDRTCIAIQLNEAEQPGCASRSFEVPWALAGLAPLRHEIASFAAAAHFDQAATSALVLGAFETATNVIRHTPQPLPDATLHCRLEATPAGLTLILHYLGPGFVPEVVEPDFSGEIDGGFGLYIIRNSVDEVIYDTPAPGVCRIRLEQRHPPATLPAPAK